MWLKIDWSFRCCLRDARDAHKTIVRLCFALIGSNLTSIAHYDEQRVGLENGDGKSCQAEHRSGEKLDAKLCERRDARAARAETRGERRGDIAARDRVEADKEDAGNSDALQNNQRYVERIAAINVAEQEKN